MLCYVEKAPIYAVVDTAADVTIISDKVFAKLGYDAKVHKTVKMWAAGEGQVFDAKKLEPVPVTVGKNVLQWSIFVAPINDDMLLGIDILKALRAAIDLDDETLHCQSETLPLIRAGARSKDLGGHVCRVRLTKGIEIPAQSELVLPVDFPTPPKSQYLELESNQNLPVLVANSVFTTGSVPFVNLMNNTSSTITMPKGVELGVFRPLEESSFVEELHVSQCKVPPPHTSKVLPERLKPLLEGASDKLGAADREELRKTLIEFQDVFAESEFDLGNFTALHHHIDTGDSPPIKLPLRKTPLHFLGDEEKLLDEMLRAEIIEPSTSSWAAAPVLVRKKNGKLRWCIDFRLCNQVTKPDVYPMPLMSDCIDALDGNVWFSKLDANSAYWQIPLAPESKEKTAFRTRQGLFQFNKLPFGLSNAPSTFCRAMNLVLRGMNWKTVLSFLDDICVLGRSSADHIKNLREVFQRFREFGLKLKPEKCELFQEEIEFLGRKVNAQGMTLTDHSISVIRGWKEPSSVKEVQQFLGLANYHRNFIKNFSQKAEPLNRLLKKKSFFWGEEQAQAFRQLQEELLSPGVLSIPNPDDKFILDTDACDTAIGAELIQVQGGVEKVIAYGSFALSQAQQKYCTTRKELLAVVRFTNHFRHYLLGRQFLVRTDHNSLTWLMNFRHVEGQLARWLEELQRFSMEIQHRPGIKHGNADALSRRTSPESCNLTASSLPCRGCNHCVKVENKWKEFEQLIDDVVELSSRPISTIEGEQPVRKGAHMDPSVRLVVTRPSVRLGEPCLPAGQSAPTPSVRPVVQTGPQSSDEDDDDDNDAPWTDATVREAQEKDASLTFLRLWLENTQTPTEAELKLAGPIEKFYWANRDRFKISEGIVYHMGENRDQLVIPESLKSEILKLCHDIPTSGHQGIARTKERIQRNYFWFRINKDVVDHIARCMECALSKTGNRKLKHPMVVNQAGIPMEKVHIDFLGPLPKSKKGNEHILVMVDSFTKWIECIPLQSQTAEVTARAAVNGFFSRFGYPLQLVSDQGRNFESNLFSEMCKLLHIRKSRTTAYRPSANGQAERMNRTLMAAVRCFVGKCHDEWDEYVPLIASAIRSSVNRNTGFTPNRMMLGREVNTPAEIMVPNPMGEPSSPVDLVRNLESHLQLAHKTARETLKVELKRAKSYYDLNKRVGTFQKGDVVFCLNHAPQDKLHPKWVGPCVVLEVRSPFLFKLKNRNREWTANHDSLKPYLGTNLPIWVKKLQKKIAEDKLNTFCLCGKPDDGLLMVECQSCLDWFHGKCVKLTRRQANRIDYVCPDCL